MKIHKARVQGAEGVGQSTDQGEFSMEATVPSGFLPALLRHLCGHPSLEIFPDAWEKGVLGLSLDSPLPGVLYDCSSNFHVCISLDTEPPDSQKLESHSFL